jgi:hypothetical protein
MVISSAMTCVVFNPLARPSKLNVLPAPPEFVDCTDVDIAAPQNCAIHIGTPLWQQSTNGRDDRDLETALAPTHAGAGPSQTCTGV